MKKPYVYLKNIGDLFLKLRNIEEKEFLNERNSTKEKTSSR